MAKPVIFSGIQPTGNLHIGNYLGAVKNWVALQNSGKYQCYFFIADYHSLTGQDTAEDRRKKITTLAAEIVALGIDPTVSTFFVQSHISEHTELAWIFNCVTPVAELERMTQFKDKSSRQEKNINAGLFTYPVLQVADVLLYHGTLVPVGQDQVQHIELIRVIAKAFNKRYGEYFPETKHLLTNFPKVMSLLEPTKKMSKSLGAGHVIELSEEPDQIVAKLKKAVTASEGGGEAPGVQNLLLLLKEFGTKETYDTLAKAEKNGTIRYGDLKSELSAAITNYFADFRHKRAELLMHPQKLEAILADGAEKARGVAQKTMADVRRLVGIR
jgi:tryptophanyl-tRNA synthetase